MAVMTVQRVLLALHLTYAAVALPTTTAAGSASTFAGSTVSAVFPPPNATDTSIDTFFPDASQVGHAGPTPSTSQWYVAQNVC